MEWTPDELTAWCFAIETAMADDETDHELWDFCVTWFEDLRVAMAAMYMPLR